MESGAENELISICQEKDSIIIKEMYEDGSRYIRIINVWDIQNLSYYNEDCQYLTITIRNKDSQYILKDERAEIVYDYVNLLLNNKIDG